MEAVFSDIGGGGKNSSHGSCGARSASMGEEEGEGRLVRNALAGSGSSESLIGGRTIPLGVRGNWTGTCCFVLY